MTDKPELKIIDASGYLFRAYYGLPPMTSPGGTPVNAIYGFCQMLGKLAKSSHGQYLVVALDSSGKSFRHEIYPEYKANRDAPPEDLVPQFSLMHDALKAFGLHALGAEGFEADDVIASLADQATKDGARVQIISSDKDMMQLIVDGCVSLWDPMKNRLLDSTAAQEKFGVPPQRVIDVQALAGDSSDNIPGVPKIGIKTAAELINRFGDLDTLLASTDEITQTKRRENLQEFADLARISRQLVTLKRDVPLEQHWQEFLYRPPNPEVLSAFFQKMGFQSLQKRLGEFFLDALKPAEEAVSLAKPEYSLVISSDALQQWLNEAREIGMIGFDIETDGLDPLQTQIVGFSLSLPDRRACYVPFAHRGTGLGLEVLQEQCPEADALRLLKDILEDPGIVKIGQNLKFDAQVCAQYGIELAPLDDTMLMSFVLEAGRYPNEGHGLDRLAKRHLHHTMIAYKDVVGQGRQMCNFAEISPAQARDYAAEDADIALQLSLLFKNRLREEKLLNLYETLERPLSPVLRRMEARGILLDHEALKALGREWQKRLATLAERIHTLAGGDFNIASPKQLGEILFGRLALAGGKKTSTGQYSTDHSVLESLRDDHEIVDLILQWRELSKLASTYVEGLLGAINPKTWRVHTLYAMTGAQTGRLSSREPNLQNIPVRSQEGQRIRRGFIAPKGRKLLSLDYSQIELRLLAEIANLENMKEAFARAEDIHATTASNMFDIPPSSITAEDRRRAKAINFGIIYGISAFGLAKQLGIPRQKAQEFIDRYFTRFPGIRHYMDTQIAFCQKHGYVKTLFGRRIYLPDINTKNHNRRMHAERQAINAPIQGTAADIIKRAMIRIDRALGKDNDIQMLLQVHDELVFEVPEDFTTPETLVEIMEQAARPGYHNSVHLMVEAGFGQHWAEAH